MASLRTKLGRLGGALIAKGEGVSTLSTARVSGHIYRCIHETHMLSLGGRRRGISPVASRRTKFGRLGGTLNEKERRVYVREAVGC